MGEAPATGESEVWTLVLLAGIVGAAWIVHRRPTSPQWNLLVALLGASRDNEEADSTPAPDSDRNTPHVS